MDFFNIDLLIRLSVAIALAFVLGLERELTNKYAGLRTHILVCLGACLFTIISIYGFPTFATGDNVVVDNSTGIRDTGRVAAQIVTGIGFIGAGTVLRNGPMIIGLTTAATLWISAAIGMACGVAMYDIAAIATFSSVAVLTLIRVFERKILPIGTKKSKRIKAIVYCNNDLATQVHEYILSATENVEDFTVKKLIENQEKSKITAIFELSNAKASNEVYNKLVSICGPDSISLQGLND